MHFVKNATTDSSVEESDSALWDIRYVKVNFFVKLWKREYSHEGNCNESPLALYCGRVAVGRKKSWTGYEHNKC